MVWFNCASAFRPVLDDNEELKLIPYIEQPAWHIGPLTIHAFGIAVAAAILIGLSMSQRRFGHLGLDQGIGHRFGGWMLVGGIVGAHLFSVLLYFPDKLRENPWHLLRVWEDISSFGGMVGGAIGGYLFFSLRLRETDSRTKLAYLDVAAFVFAPALAVGRIGCALAHDHPGVVTTFPLAISLETEAARDYLSRVYDAAGRPFPSTAEAMGFHDLGLYEFLFLALVIVPAFAYWDRRQRPAGFFLVAFAMLYLPVRFGFDMLRVADARYVGLTPAQWVAAAGLAVLPLAAVHERKLRFAIIGAVLLATAWACWSAYP
jgi:phosphatidylglycerol:prolipoprotein diacylglycerol transferase